MNGLDAYQPPIPTYPWWWDRDQGSSRDHPRPVVCECPSQKADISHTVSLDRTYVTALACKDSDVVCQQAKWESLWNKLEVYTSRCFCKAFKIADFDPSDPKK